MREMSLADVERPQRMPQMSTPPTTPSLDKFHREFLCEGMSALPEECLHLAENSMWFFSVE